MIAVNVYGGGLLECAILPVTAGYLRDGHAIQPDELLVGLQKACGAVTKLNNYVPLI